MVKRTYPVGGRPQITGYHQPDVGRGKRKENGGGEQETGVSNLFGGDRLRGDGRRRRVQTYFPQTMSPLTHQGSGFKQQGRNLMPYGRMH